MMLANNAVPSHSLDLTNGHLRTSLMIEGEYLSKKNDFPFDDSIPFNKNPRFSPMIRGFGEVALNWFKLSPLPGASGLFDSCPWVAKLQRFVAGGFEVVIVKVDLEKIARAMDGERKGGKREPREQNDNDIISSKNRAKKQLRKLIKSMGCDRLLTLTRRESELRDFWQAEDWAKAWKKFVRLCADLGVSLNYVAVLERHKKGNLHLHAAICGNVNIKTIRQLWWVCCGGRGLGNVDISFKHNLTSYQRRAGVAKYVSKYITKQANVAAFNKKRYWASRHKLPPVERYVLNGSNVVEGLMEFVNLFGLDFKVTLQGAYQFADGAGLWFDFSEAMALPPDF